MSLLVRYTLKSADDHGNLKNAISELMTGLKAAAIAGLNYSCFSTEEPTEFIGVLEFDSEDGCQAFLNSEAFEAYKAKVGPIFANPPQTTRMAEVASTKD